MTFFIIIFALALGFAGATIISDRKEIARLEDVNAKLSETVKKMTTDLINDVVRTNK